jgi:hypothetical protein
VSVSLYCEITFILWKVNSDGHQFHCEWTKWTIISHLKSKDLLMNVLNSFIPIYMYFTCRYIHVLMWAYIIFLVLNLSGIFFISDLTMSVPDEVYFRLDYECTWWSLFQTWLWVYLMKFISETCRNSIYTFLL